MVGTSLQWCLETQALESDETRMKPPSHVRAEARILRAVKVLRILKIFRILKAFKVVE